jgi:hypothetical protein
MGKGCSCLKSKETETLQIAEDETKEVDTRGVSPLKVDPRPADISLGDLMKLQGLLRGYLDRRRLKEISRTKTIVMHFDDGSTDRKINFYKKSSSANNDSETLPSSFVEKMERKLGSFNCPGIRDELGVRRRPIQTSTGVYTGDLNALNQHHGFGTFVWNDGSKYEGFWHNGKACGKGRLINAVGGVYEGDWVDDKANGNGKYIYSDGSVYDGQWLNDKQNGSGKENWPDGSWFTGNFIMGKKFGKGEYFWADGTSYSGEFKENKFHGYGKYVWKDKSIYIGEWSESKKSGKGIFTWEDGRKYEGDFANDKKQGFGIFTWPDGRRYEGAWKDGKQAGKGFMITATGQRLEGLWEDGKLIEEHTDKF